MFKSKILRLFNYKLLEDRYKFDRYFCEDCRQCGLQPVGRCDYRKLVKIKRLNFSETTVVREKELEREWLCSNGALLIIHA